MFFNVGFRQDFTAVPPGVTPGTCTMACSNLCIPDVCTYPANWTCDTPAGASLDSNNPSFANINNFVVEAHSHLDSRSCGDGINSHIETWLINERGLITALPNPN